MTSLKNAPLIYTIVMIQFPRIPNIQQFTDKFFDLLRKDYPLDEEISAPVFNAHITSEGVKFQQHEARFWQFASVELAWAFVLTDQMLCLHTIKYLHFKDFHDRFLNGLKALISIPDIGVQWVNSIGLRYVNLIEAKKGEDIKNYIKDWVLPAKPPKTSFSIVEGTYIARYKTEAGEMRLQAMRTPPFTLPPELNSPLIIKNRWLRDRPENDFALIDTDHFHKCETPSKIEISSISNKLENLNEVSKKVFNSIGTDLAKKFWKGQ